MTEPDIVAELDRMLRWYTIGTDEGLVIQRARDELVMLRQRNPLEEPGVRTAMVAVMPKSKTAHSSNFVCILTLRKNFIQTPIPSQLHQSVLQLYHAPQTKARGNFRRLSNLVWGWDKCKW